MISIGKIKALIPEIIQIQALTEKKEGRDLTHSHTLKALNPAYQAKIKAVQIPKLLIHSVSVGI